MTKHSVERTSPKGQPFIGTCRLCGKQGLTLATAMSGDCDNQRGLSSDEALLEAIDPAPERVNYEQIAHFLFGLLDDIDTASDEAKDNHDYYRKRVEHLNRRRFEVAETDGFEVTFRASSQGDAS